MYTGFKYLISLNNSARMLKIVPYFVHSKRASKTQIHIHICIYIHKQNTFKNRSHLAYDALGQMDFRDREVQMRQAHFETVNSALKNKQNFARKYNQDYYRNTDL